MKIVVASASGLCNDALNQGGKDPAERQSNMKTRFNWKVTAKCNKAERDGRFLAFSLKVGGDAKARLEMASEMKWIFTNKREADRFARKARKSSNGFESVEVARNV